MAERTESSIVINAPADRVMDVIADVLAYPEWSDGVQSVEILTTYEDLRPADVVFVVDAGAIKDKYQLEYDWADSNRVVTWTLTSGEVLKAMDGAYRLTENGDATTTVVYQLAVDVSIPMIGMIRRKAEKVIVDTALKGLKERVEKS
ncbi:MAG: SRPBCC family protein [Actinomycetes bacterium]|jgi:ribosome-associated toxin RatA of RatAB toxin-antitoxin module